MPAVRRRVTANKTINTRSRAAQKRAAVSAEHAMKVEREKHLALWAGVIFFMAMVVFVWVLNFKQTVSATVQAPAGEHNDVALSDLLDNLKTAMSQTKAGISELQHTLQNDGQQQSDGQTIQDLQNRLAQMEQRIQLEKLLGQLNEQIKQIEGTSTGQ